MPMDADSHSTDPTPVTIIAGFLGAGKTTLLNRILTGAGGPRTAVLVNDFGALNIDAQLIVGVESSGIVSLANGCICCTIRDDLLEVALKLVRRRDAPEYMVVEASGVSNPFAVIQTFMLPELAALIQLDAAITVVDAEQFAAADIVVVNKTDLVSAEPLSALRAQLTAFQPRLFETSYGQLPLELLVGIGHQTVDRLLSEERLTTGEPVEFDGGTHHNEAHHDTLL